MASGFSEIFNSNGSLMKTRAHFGRGKEVCFSMHNKRVYCHISDKSKAFVNGSFDITKCKNVSLGEDELFFFKSLLNHFDHYAMRMKLEQQPQHVSISFDCFICNKLINYHFYNIFKLYY